MTLTEQFENDKLVNGTYYCRSKSDGHQCLAAIRYDGELYDADYNGTLNKGYWEVLAPVPSYDEYIKFKSDIKNLAKLVLKLSPERKEWLEKHYGEYL